MVSVVIPTYKRPDQLLSAVNSVLQQTYKDFEIVVVNDNKDDHETISALLGTLKDPRIKYLKNERKKGGNGARNTGILHSNGEFIAFLDDDDTWFPEKLAEQVSKMESLDNSWAGCYCGWETDGVLYTAGNDGDLISPFLTKKCPLGASSTLLIRKSVIKESGLWDEDLNRFQDYLFFIAIIVNYKFGFVEKPLLRINGHNIPGFDSLKISNDQYLEKVSLFKKIVDHPDYSYFLARQYRDMALYAAINGYVKDVNLFLRKSVKYKILPLKNYLSVLVYFVNYFTFKFEFGLSQRKPKSH